jgi:ABC-type dipeptide/oligopeptide/nickel transport system permease subunit
VLEPTAEPMMVDASGLGGIARSQTRSVMGRFLRHRVAATAMLLLLLMSLAAVFAPSYYKYSFDEFTADKSSSPSGTHWFGTDELGKDTFANVMRGTTKSLQVGFLVAVSSTLVGVLFGALAGYYGRWVDALLMRFTDLFLTLPSIAILLVAASRFRDSPNNWLAISLVIAAFTWMYQARLTRSEFLSLRERDFVKSARALGASDSRIIVRHILPNSVGSIIVNATLTVALAILAEATLSFLGFGVTTSLGELVSRGESAARTRWWLFYTPGLWLVALLLCVNFIGDGLRDAFDPSRQRVRA